MTRSFLFLLAAVAAAPKAPSIPGYLVRADGGPYVEVISRRQTLGLAPPGMQIPPGKARDAARAVRRFVYGHADLFGLDPAVDSLALIQSAAAEKGVYVVFRQWHLGRWVADAESNAYVGSDGSIARIKGYFERGIQIDPIPRLTPERALQVAKPRHPGVLGARPRIEPVCFRRVGRTVHLVYLVFLPHRGQPDFRVAVDADSGEILEDVAMPTLGH